MSVYLVCSNCPGEDAYPAPEIDGVPTISVETLTRLQTSNGTHVMPMCPSCCDAITAGIQVAVASAPDEITPP